MAVTGTAQARFGASSNLISSSSSVTRKLGAGLAGISAVSDLGSAIRSGDITSGAEALGDLSSAFASFGGDANENDWRVRLTLPSWPSFRSSPVLAPLKDAGGLIFPYTPQVTIQSSATYNAIETVHTNFKFQAFKNSDPGSITITAPMNVEDSTQGLYWIAAVHYLRSLTKMFTGLDPKAGNPPPVVKLNGYGNYVFKNVPVVVTQFSTTLPNDCDYIAVPVVGSMAGAIEGIADSVGGIADSLGGAGIGLGGLTDSVSSIAGGIGQIAGLAGSLGLGGKTSGGISYVPTKSSFQVTLQPIYSRASSRTFSLDRFVQGGYLTNSFGYI
jgi:hypothetical protein